MKRLRGGRSNVRVPIMTAGKVLYENGQFFAGEEPEMVYREAKNTWEMPEG